MKETPLPSHVTQDANLYVCNRCRSTMTLGTYFVAKHEIAVRNRWVAWHTFACKATLPIKEQQ